MLALALSFSFSSKAKAEFNVGNAGANNAGFKDWSTTSLAGSTSAPTSTSSKDFTGICNDMFRFQKENILQGPFCAIISVSASATAEFATNSTCTIQAVGMSNYDNSITFSSPLSATPGSTTGLCTGTNNSGGPLKVSGNNIFGVGKLLSTGTNSGIYDNKNYSQLTADLEPNNSGPGGWVNSGFRIVRGIAVSLGLILLFLIAFANILHIDINTYTVKRMLPNLIIALIGGYLAIYMIFILSRGVDFLYQFQVFSPYNAVHPFYNIMGGGASLGLHGVYNSVNAGQEALNVIFNIGGTVMGSAASDNKYSLVSGVLGTIFIFIPSVVVFAFEYVLALRPIVVGILTVISPIAFACYVMPQTQGLFRKWWTIMLIALFYTPAVNFIFYLMNTVSAPTGAGGLMLAVSILVKSAVIIFLIRLPFTIENDIKKLSLSLSKSSLAANLGLSKGANAELKVKQQNAAGVVTDKILESKAAQSIIAPTNRNLNRNVTNTTNKEETRSFARTFSSIVNRSTGGINAREVESISAKAHKANLDRPSGLLVNTISDIKPQTFRKILNTSNQSLFRETNIVNELRNKNGQVLDNQGALMRADAARKVTSLAKVVDQNRIVHPEAVKSLAQKGMLDVLPIEVLKLSLQQGIINPVDLKTNFKNPEAAYNKIINFKRGLPSEKSPLDENALKVEMEKDNKDATSGYLDLKSAIRANLESQAPLSTSTQNTSKVIESLHSQNQTYFDKNATYYIERLKETNNKSKETIAKTLQVAGTPAKTAVAIAQNPSLPFEQIKRYLPTTATPEIVNTIKQSVDSRDITQDAIGQISKALKEDKSVIGKAVVQKVSESFKSGSSRNFDDLKGQLTQAVKTLSSNPSPQDAKKAVSQVSSFAPGTALSGAATPSVEDIERTKDKGEEVVNTIDEMKMAGIKEQTVVSNPTQAVEQLDTHISEQIGGILAGQTKEGKTIEGQIAEVAVTKPASALKPDDQKEVPETDEDESMKSIDQIDSDQKQAQSILSAETKDGKSFDQQIGDISSAGNKKA